MKKVKLMSRDERRAILFAPINIQHYGGCGQGGTAVIDHFKEKPEREYTPGTTAGPFQQFTREQD
jgi:hypothetical protein